MQKYFVKAAIYLASASIAALQPVAAAPEEKSLTVNGYEMPYLEDGNGPLLILLHGFVSDMRTWQDKMPELAKNFRVIAPTQRYFGKGNWEKAWPTFNRDLLADDVAALIRALDSGAANLAGWSMGSQVAHITSLRYPELVRSAYLFEGTAPIQLTEAQAKEDAALSAKYWGPVIKTLKEKGPQGTIKQFIDTVVGHPDAWNRLPEMTKEMHRDNARIFAFAGPKYSPKSVTCDQIKASPIPTRYVYGTDSVAPFQRGLSRIRDCVGTAPIEIVRAATHEWPAADVGGFVRSVSAFVLIRETQR